MYWEDSNINQTIHLPFDINDNCIFEIVINTKKRFDAGKDGRHCGPLRGIKRIGFSGDWYISTCLGTFECYYEDCSYLIKL